MQREKLDSIVYSVYRCSRDEESQVSSSWKNWRWKPSPGASSARSPRKVSMLLRSGFRTSINEAAPGELRNQADKADQVGWWFEASHVGVNHQEVSFHRFQVYTSLQLHCWWQQGIVTLALKLHGSQGDWTKRRICAAPTGPMLSTKQTIVTMTSERMPLFELLVPSCPHMFKRKNVSRIGDWSSRTSLSYLQQPYYGHAGSRQYECLVLPATQIQGSFFCWSRRCNSLLDWFLSQFCKDGVQFSKQTFKTGCFNIKKRKIMSKREEKNDIFKASKKSAMILILCQGFEDWPCWHSPNRGATLGHSAELFVVRSLGTSNGPSKPWQCHGANGSLDSHGFPWIPIKIHDHQVPSTPQPTGQERQERKLRGTQVTPHLEHGII